MNASIGLALIEKAVRRSILDREVNSSHHPVSENKWRLRFCWIVSLHRIRCWLFANLRGRDPAVDLQSVLSVVMLDPLTL